MGQQRRGGIAVIGVAMLAGCGPTTTAAPTATSSDLTPTPVTPRPVTPTPAASPQRTTSAAPSPTVTPTSTAIAWVDRPVAVQPPWTGPVRVHRTPLYRRCTSADLTARASNAGGAAGTTFEQVILTNRSTSPCTLKGVPEAVVGIDGRGRGDRLSVDAQPYNLAIDPIANLRPGHTGLLMLSHNSGCGIGHHYPPFDQLDVGLPGGGVVRARTDRDPTLVRGCSITTSDFGTQHVDHPDPHVFAASISVPAQLPAGNPVTYTVTLTNPGVRPISLRPCPSYTEQALVLVAHSSAVLVSRGTYSLNCDGVSAIGPHQALTFAMRIVVPEAIGPAKVSWQLQGTPVLTGAASEALLRGDPQPALAGGASDPRICGPWSAATAPTGRTLAARFGDLRSCARVPTGDWLITTTGKPARPGVVLLYHCHHRAVCADGRTDHPASGWSAVALPGRATEASLEGTPLSGWVDMTIGLGDRVFDLSTETFLPAGAG